MVEFTTAGLMRFVESECCGLVYQLVRDNPAHYAYVITQNMHRGVNACALELFNALESKSREMLSEAKRDALWVMAMQGQTYMFGLTDKVMKDCRMIAKAFIHGDPMPRSASVRRECRARPAGRGC